MRRLILLALAALFVASVSNAATIVRGTKSSGGTAFVDGFPALAAEVNKDFDTLYTAINGNLDATNLTASANIAATQILSDSITNTQINSAAAIVYSKLAQTAAQQDADIVDDFSADTAEQATETSPGDSITASLATNLEEELARLRYAIHRNGLGLGASELNESGGTAAVTTWRDGRVTGHNLLYNGGFNLWSSSSPSAGDGWDLVATPSTLAAEALVESEGQGDGNGINIISNAVSEGISQTLDGLKADTKYLAMVMVRPDVTDCNLSTVGADTNELSITSTSGGSAWELLSGTFETDSTPTDVALQLLALSSASDCVFLDAAVYEVVDDPLPRNGGVVVATDDNSDGSFTNDMTASYTTPSGISAISVTPPSSGYIISVWAYATASNDTASTQTACQWQITENASQVAVAEHYDEEHTSPGLPLGVSMHYVNTSPTAGTAYSYLIQSRETDGACTYTDAEDQVRITVRMEPTG